MYRRENSHPYLSAVELAFLYTVYIGLIGFKLTPEYKLGD